MRLRDLPNLGPRSEEWLRSVGITDVAMLAEVGPVEAYRRLLDAQIRGLSLNALWAMEGALEGVDWRLLPPERRQELRDELER
jgi:DNA transformation protein